MPEALSEVFAFFSDAGNLQRITPKALGFRILTPGQIVMQEGTTIDYRIRLYGLPLRWTSLIECFEPERRFVDLQTRGPYRYWRHAHQFEEIDEGTVVHDLVEYEIPLGAIGSAVHWLFVRRSLDQIFNYRRQMIDEIFGGS